MSVEKPDRRPQDLSSAAARTQHSRTHTETSADGDVIIHITHEDGNPEERLVPKGGFTKVYT